MRFSMMGLARSNQSVSAGTAPGTHSKQLSNQANSLADIISDRI